MADRDMEEHIESLAEVAGMETEEMAEMISAAGSDWDDE